MRNPSEFPLLRNLCRFSYLLLILLLLPRIFCALRLFSSFRCPFSPHFAHFDGHFSPLLPIMVGEGGMSRTDFGPAPRLPAVRADPQPPPQRPQRAGGGAGAGSTARGQSRWSPVARTEIPWQLPKPTVSRLMSQSKDFFFQNSRPLHDESRRPRHEDREPL